MCQRLTLEQFGFVLALFSHRRLPPFEFTSHYAFAPRPTSRVRSCTDPPAGYCLTPTAELAKTERGPISRSGPSIFSMSPNQAISSEKSNLAHPAFRGVGVTSSSTNVPSSDLPRFRTL